MINIDKTNISVISCLLIIIKHLWMISCSVGRLITIFHKSFNLSAVSNPGFPPKIYLQ